MLNTTLLKFLSTLTPMETKDFNEFVRSPYFNKNENVVKLYNYLRKFYPDFNDIKLQKEKVYERLYNKGKYNDGFMRTLMFNLNKLLEDYLTYINFSKDKIKSGISLLREINERKIDKVFSKKFEKIENMNESSALKSPEYFLNKYYLSHQRETYNLWNKSEYSIALEEGFHNANSNLTYFYLGNILKEFRYLIYKKDFGPSDYNSDFLEHILEFLSVKDNIYIKNPYINLHVNEIFLQKEKSQKYYSVLKDILKNDTDKLSLTDRFSLQNILQIFCISRVFAGDESFRKERFELYKIILEQKLYSPVSQEYFEETLFANIVTVGISLGEFDWIENFISEFNEKLPNNRDTIVNFSLAKLNFEKGNYKEALTFLNSIESVRHEHLKFPLRTLTLLTLYELDSMTQVFYQIDSYRHYLSKNKKSLNEERAQRIGNFLKFFNKLAKLNEKPNSSELKKLKNELETNTNILERTWLLKKVNELSKSIKNRN